MNAHVVLNADLHCHSTVSDGTLSPVDVVLRAHANGVDLLALTDHDEVGGLAEARNVAGNLGLQFINGVEISVSWQGDTIHIVGLNIDPNHPSLLAGLAQIKSGRTIRAQKIAQALEAMGIPNAFEGAMRYAENAELISRAHFARYLIELKWARDMPSVFQHYLVRGKPGYVAHEWASLKDALGWIHDAGGVSVIAHPGRYRISQAQRQQLFEEFKALHGMAIEVVSGSHGTAQIAGFAHIARQYGFLASRASDFHSVTESPIDLGRAPPLPLDLIPVWTVF